MTVVGVAMMYEDNKLTMKCAGPHLSLSPCRHCIKSSQPNLGAFSLSLSTVLKALNRLLGGFYLHHAAIQPLKDFLNLSPSCFGD